MESNVQFFKSISPYIILTALIVFFSLSKDSTKDKLYSSAISNSVRNNDNIPVVITNNDKLFDINDNNAVGSFLTSKRFKNVDGGISTN